MSEAQLFKQMELGTLIASEVLPKVAKEYRKAALEGGAYELALKGLTVTEGKFLTQSQKAGDKIFKGGFSVGLAKLYDDLAKLLRDMGPQLEKFGDLFGRVFKGLAHAILVLEPLLKVLIDNLEIAFGAAMIYKISTFATATQVALRKAFLPIFAAVAAVEELASLMNDKLVGGIERSLGFQVNLKDGTTSAFTEKDGKLIAGETTAYGYKGNKNTLDTLSQLNPTRAQAIGSLSGAFAPVAKSFSYYGDMLGFGAAQPQQNVTVHNTFPNVDLDTYNQIQQQSMFSAMMPQTK